MKKRIKANHRNAEVNMTPMLDIVFILLIFFIVTASFIREEGLDVTKHKNDTEDQPNKEIKPVVLQVCADQTIKLDNRGIDKRAVRANIERKMAEFGNISVVVETAPEAPTGLLVQVMDQAMAAKAPVSIAPANRRCDEIQSLVVN